MGKGTGTGLDISYRIIQQHSGSVEVPSAPGNTRFIVRLPHHRHSRRFYPPVPDENVLQAVLFPSGVNLS